MCILSSHHTFLIISKELGKSFAVMTFLQYLMTIQITVMQDSLSVGKLLQNHLIAILTVLNVYLNPLSSFNAFLFFLWMIISKKFCLLFLHVDS